MARLWFVIILLFLLLALSIRIYAYYSSLKPLSDGESIDATFLLLTDPTIEGKFQKFSFVPDRRGRIFVTVPSYPRYVYGQQLRLRGKVKARRIDKKSTQDASTERLFLLRTDNVINTMFFPTIEAKEIWYLSPLARVRRNLITIFSSYLSPASESLMLGIVFGVRSTMPKSLADDLVTTGVIHITAASGMNVTMVAGAVFFLLSGIMKRQMAIVTGFLCVWIYAVLAGFEPSILRASIMSSFAFAAALLGRQNTSLVALFLTSTGMIFFDPSLSVSAGFLLSVFSTLGIILFGGVGARKAVPSVSDPVTEKARRETTLFFVAFWDDFRTTLSAQAGTLPILFVFFGQYNVLSLLVNGLILFTIPPLMILGGLAAALGFVYRPLAAVILYLSLPLLVYIEFVVEHFAKIPIYLMLGSVSLFLVIGYYLIFFAIYLLFRRKRS